MAQWPIDDINYFMDCAAEPRLAAEPLSLTSHGTLVLWKFGIK